MVMSDNIRITLVGDGKSDKVLKYPLGWLLDQLFPDHVFEFEFSGEKKPKWKLADKINYALELFPCDLLMVHRDVENQTIAQREQEVQEAINQIKSPGPRFGFISVTPIKMSEAWLLIDEQAIREAAGNPNGKEPLPMPSIQELERMDAKKKAEELLQKAHGGRKRQRKKFNSEMAKHKHLLAKNIEDFALCHRLYAFQRLHDHLNMMDFSQDRC